MLAFCVIIHCGAQEQIISNAIQGTGVDLGILIWWGCKYNCAQSARKIFTTMPTFNEPHPF